MRTLLPSTGLLAGHHPPGRQLLQWLWLVLMLVAPAAAQAQTTLINETFEGANSFNVVNGTQTNKWFVGTPASNGPTNPGSNAAYISSDAAGATHAYNNGSGSVVHLFQDVAIPAGQTILNLSFDWRANGETSFDDLRAFLVPTSTTPAAGTSLSSGQIGANLSGQSAYGRISIPFAVSAATAGTTQRLVISWRNDGFGGSNPPGAVDNVLLTSRAPIPLSGLYTINGTQATTFPGGTNFQSISAAINALNADGISGAVTFNISAGQTFVENPPVITATGAGLNTITFQRTGAGANPVLQISTATAGIDINGGDLFTFTGLDVVATTSTPTYGYRVRNVNATNGAFNNTIQDASITLNRGNTSSAGVMQTSNSTGGGVTATNASGNNQNNRYLRLTISNAYSGVRLLGTSASFPDYNTEVAFCTIGGTSANDLGGGGSSTAYGIQASSLSKVSLHDNLVRNVGISTTFTSVYGIYVEQSTGTGTDAGNVYNNQISNIRNASTTNTSSVYGIRAEVATSGTHTLNVYNNVISTLSCGFTGSSTASRIIRGLGIQMGGGGSTAQAINVSHNTVVINGTASPNASNTCYEIGTTSGPVISTRNNIFANLTTGQTSSSQGKHYAWITTSSTGAPGSTGSVSDYNDLYIASGTGDAQRGYTGAWGTPVTGNSSAIDKATLANWQGGPPAARDANSVAVDPALNSIFKPTAVGADNKGTPAGIGTDLLGVSRSATTPDPGAYEFDAGDTTPPTITYTPLASTTSTASRTLEVTITDAGSGVATGANAPRIYYRKSTSQSYVSAQATSVSGNVYTFTIDYAALPGGSAASPDIIQYYVAAQDAASVPNGASSPTGSVSVNLPGSSFGGTPNQYQIQNSLSGTYYVGTGTSPDPAKTYATLTAAAAAYNAGDVTGSVTFLLLDATYSTATGETFPITFNANATALAGTFRLTVKPNAGVTPTLTGSNATAILALNGADYVTFDGSNTAGGSTRDWTISNTNTGTNSFVVLVSVPVSGADNATNNEVLNLNVVGSGNAQTQAGIGLLTAAGNTAGNANNSFRNNAVRAAQHGILTQGTSATVKNTGTVITQNELSATGTNSLGRGGIWVRFEDGVQITRNTIGNIVFNGTADVWGINAGFAGFSNSTFTGSEVTNATIAQNTIGVVQQTNTYSAVGIGLASAASGTSTIANNAVAGVSSNGTSGDFGAGIMLGGGTGSTTRVLYNSVSMTGTQTGGNQPGFALAVGGTTPTVEIRNNILLNTQSTGIGTGVALGLAYAGTAGSYAGLTSTNNAFLVSSGSGFAVGMTGGLATGTARTSLADLHAETGQDRPTTASSPAGTSLTLSASPFASATDLHVNPLLAAAFEVNGAATPVSSLTVDYDGDGRNASTPDIGADEFSPPFQDVGITALVQPAASNCYSGTQPVQVTIRNFGGAATTAPVPVTVTITEPNGTTTQTVSGTFSASIAAGATANFVVGSYAVTGSGTYTFAATTAYAADPDQSNNALAPQAVSVTVPDAISLVAAPTGAVCAGTSITLTASSSTAYAYTWSSPAGGNLQSTSGASVTATPSQTTTYTVTGTSGSCSIQQTITITVNPAPVLSVAPASSSICSGSTQTLTASGSISGTPQTILATATFDGGANGFTAASTGASGTGFGLQAAPYTPAPTYTGGPSAYNGPSGAGTGGFFIANSGAGGSSSTTNTQLTSPAFSTVGYATASLSFQQFYKYWSSDAAARVEFSTNGGSTWTTLTDYKTAAVNSGSGSGAETLQVLALPAAALGQASVQIRFNYQSVWGYYWAIDNVGVTGTLAPTYSWTLVSGNGLPATSNTATITVAPTQTSVYQVTATDTQTGCSSTATATVTVNPRPTAAVSSTPGSVDPGQAATVSVALTGTGPWTFSYTTNGANPQTVTGTSTNPYTFSTGPLSSPATYAVTSLTDANCAATAADLAGASATVGINAPTLDVAVVALLSPATSGSCVSGPQSLTVRIQNAGTQPLDFSTNPVTVDVNVTGAVTQAYSTTLSTGTLAANATQDVTLTTTLDMSAAGTYTFASSATTAPADPNPGNDTRTDTRTIPAAPAVTVTRPTEVCAGASFTITATTSTPTFTGSAAPNAPIPDNSTAGVSSAVTLSGAPAGAVISSGSVVQVTLNIAHSWAADVQVYLVAPGNTGTLELTTGNGGSGDNYTNTVLSTAATNVIGSTGNNTAPFTGTYRPEGTTATAPAANSYSLPAAALNGTPVNGTWTLHVFDNTSSDMGTLNSWSLEISNPTTTSTLVGPAGATISGPVVSGSASTFTVSNAPVGANGFTLTTTDNTTSCATTNSFTVTSTETSTWSGAVSTSWATAGNWSGCVPDQTINALIPAGLSRYPVLSSGGADVKTLTIAGGATLTHSGSTLRIWGDLINNGTATFSGGTVQFRGAAAQTITGALSFSNVTVNKSADTLRVAANQTIGGNLTMTSGVLKTYAPGTVYQLALGGTLTETATSMVLGNVVSSATLGTDGASSTFGGLGLTLTARSTGGANLPGATTVTRSTGRPAYGMAGSKSIRRQYNVQPAVDNNLNVDMVFGYNDSAYELMGLGEASLTLFSDAGVPGGWRQEGFSSRDATANTVTLNNLNHLSIWTLGSEATPLPVSLVAFTAQRQGADALLRWTTAQEKNSRGFEVQVSADGRSFRTLGFVASETPTATSQRHYQFQDREAGKQGLRHYRLRQLDLDGSEALFGPRTVQFEGVTKLSLLALPNPFSQQLSVEVFSPGAASTELLLYDALGRVVLRQPATLSPGAQRLSLNAVEQLPTGTYLLRLSAGGQTGTLRVVKY